jgi:predicted glycosyltransferase involved in capsule biosynthesis
MPACSLIVNVLESYEVVRRQLLHLERILSPDFELIVVDDGSTPTLEETVNSVHKTFACRLCLTGDSRPWTQPRARNMGAALAQSKKLVFFDIDHILTWDILQNCLKYQGDKLHWWRKPGILDENGLLVTGRDELREYGLIDDSRSVHGNSFMIRRELFERLGGYDEQFCGGYGGDDVDFNNRYTELCWQGLAKIEDVLGQGYVFPDPARDLKKLFHHLRRDTAWT